MKIIFFHLINKIVKYNNTAFNIKALILLLNKCSRTRMVLSPTPKRLVQKSFI